ncbi:ABC-type nitrate/sulfonate/bicarbonate transport system substrate-binding protein [Paenibacillus endophyticus]|uniref:Thiamine pyrimidine synthase n=1 Tax=Paenibacillus endophyticus TaxID=1294268 RepID=A0A7W5C476_9BACL|nr:ABC transporter substrate-binding protein [Paenibacillus endophyticus]MBB3150577.1 ABC-type nitrate/sulfonate/bicarbonate transport system substrate-binding protein [Paenibacillus endophyticus]
MWKLSKKSLMIVMSACLLVLSACGSNNQPSSNAANGETGELKKVVLRLKWIHQAQFAGFYTAVEKGFYKEAGLDVEIRPGGADFPSVQMIASGTEQFGVTGADQVLMAREKGVPVKALSTIYRKTPFVLFSLKESGITKMEELVGQKIGVKLGGNEELTYRAMVKNAGIDGSKVEEMPAKYDLSPLLSGQVKAWPGYVINEVLAVQEQGHEVNIIEPGDYDINFYADTLFTTEAIIKRDPEMVKSFVQASMKGWSYAIENPDEAAEFGLKYGDKLTLDHEVSMMNASIPLLEPENLPLGKMQTDAWDVLQKNLIDLGFLKKEQNLDDVFTNEFIE